MWTDPIVEELHKTREKHAKTFQYDLKAMFDDLKKHEQQSGMTYVSLPIKRHASKRPKASSKSKEFATASNH
jgi:hypothetical protein